MSVNMLVVVVCWSMETFSCSRFNKFFMIMMTLLYDEGDFCCLTHGFSFINSMMV